tara:strand:+ start:290 stop:1072 length:783 start_codon:yes stop_codon:yes gene_type:complete
LEKKYLKFITNNMKILKDKTAIITGATRGIGRGIAETFAKQGANVLFTYSSSSDLANEIENELSKENVIVKGYKSDASSFEDCQKLVEKINKDFDVIDILINNAGITRDNLLMRMQEEDFDKVMNVNLKSVFNMTKAIQRTMLKQRFGSIINMSSVVGVKGNAGQSNYAASKAGIIGFSKSIALELGSRNIRCNVIAPGFIETEMTDALDEKIIEEWRNSIPLKRGGTPFDIANTCVWLGSDMSSYITGQTIHVNGGLLT